LNSQTRTVSEKTKSAEVKTADEGVRMHSSDESSTASDILIRSTLERSLHSPILPDKQESNGHSSSGSSKCSKTSYGVENFNSSGPQKVKISKKNLREIKPPFDKDSPRSVLSSGSSGKLASGVLSDFGESRKKVRDEVISSNDSNGERSVAAARSKAVKPVHTYDYNEPIKVDKVRKSAEEQYEDVNLARSKVKADPPNFDQRAKSSSGSSRNGEILNTGKQQVFEPPVSHFRSTPKYRVERHTPQKSQVTDQLIPNGNPEKKNLLQDLEDSIDIVTAHGKGFNVIKIFSLPPPVK